MQNMRYMLVLWDTCYEIHAGATNRRCRIWDTVGYKLQFVALYASTKDWSKLSAAFHLSIVTHLGKKESLSGRSQENMDFESFVLLSKILFIALTDNRHTWSSCCWQLIKPRTELCDRMVCKGNVDRMLPRLLWRACRVVRAMPLNWVDLRDTNLLSTTQFTRIVSQLKNIRESFLSMQSALVASIQALVVDKSMYAAKASC